MQRRLIAMLDPSKDINIDCKTFSKVEFQVQGNKMKHVIKVMMMI